MNMTNSAAIMKVVVVVTLSSKVRLVEKGSKNHSQSAHFYKFNVPVPPLHTTQQTQPAETSVEKRSPTS